MGFLSRCHSGIVTQLALEENILVLLVLQQGSSLSRWDVEELLELPQGCQGHFLGSGGKLGFLSKSLSGKGPQVALRGESPGPSRVVAGFLSSYDGYFRDPLVGPRGGPVSTQVTRGPLGFLCSLCQGRGPHLELRSETQGSALEPTWISRFLWGVHREVRAWSRVEPCKSAPLSTRKSSYTLPIGLTIGIGGLSLEMPQGCHTCHRVLSQSSGDR